MTQPARHRSPGNGAPNFKGLPPGRKRTGTESGDTSPGGVNDGDKVLHVPIAGRENKVHSRKPASARQDANSLRGLCYCEFRPRLSVFLSLWPSGGSTV